MVHKSRQQKDKDSSFFPYQGGINPTSTTLILRIQNGEMVAWNRFMELYTPLLRKWCRKPGGKLTRQDRQDITQDVLSKVGKAVKDFDVNREGRSLRAWLRTITQNTIADYLEKNEKRKNVSRLISDTGSIKEPYNKSFELTEEPDEKIILLRQVLKTIKPQFREEHWEVVDLFVNAEKTSTEIAEIMKMKPEAVRKIKSRILKRIRDEYESLGIKDELPDEIH